MTLRSFLFLLIFIAAVSAQETGRLTITSTPGGCWVRIDSVLIGKTPLDLELPDGSHDVEVYPPQNGVWNVENRRFTVQITAGQSTKLITEFPNPVYINSTPYGAALYSDTSYIGKAPVYLSFEQFHGKTLRLEKQGYKTYVFTLSSPKAVIAKLEKDDTFFEHREKPEFLGMIPKQHLKSKFTLLAVSVATHWASFYFKNLADKNYDKYQTASDPARIDQYWDNTRKYDRISDISLGVSFASLAGLVYMVIWK